MFRNRYLLLLLLGLMLTGCGSESQVSSRQSEEELLLSALQGTGEEQASKGSVQTVAVERKDIAAAYAINANRFFPFGERIVYENTYAVVTFGECLAAEGEFVNAGQELFILHQSVDEIDAEAAQRTYSRESTAYEIECAYYESRLSELEEDPNAYNILAYEYEYYQKETQKRLYELSEQIAAYDQIRKNPEVILTAPFDGYVEDVVDLAEGEKVLSDDVLMRLRDANAWYYTLEDTAQSIPVGKDVRLYADLPEGQSLEIRGVVICADMVLGSDMRKEYALVYPEQVAVDGEDVTGHFDSAMLPNKMEVELYQMELRNVLAVPKDYVYQEGENRYVYRLEDGAKVKTYVICAADNISGSSWILSGLEEGDVLALN